MVGIFLFLGIELVSDDGNHTPEAGIATFVKEQLLNEDILISIDGPEHNVLKIKPPMVIGKPEINRVNEALTRAMRRFDSQNTL